MRGAAEALPEGLLDAALAAVLRKYESGVPADAKTQASAEAMQRLMANVQRLRDIGARKRCDQQPQPEDGADAAARAAGGSIPDDRPSTSGRPLPAAGGTRQHDRHRLRPAAGNAPAGGARPSAPAARHNLSSLQSAGPAAPSAAQASTASTQAEPSLPPLAALREVLLRQRQSKQPEPPQRQEPSSTSPPEDHKQHRDTTARHTAPLAQQASSARPPRAPAPQPSSQPPPPAPNSPLLPRKLIGSNASSAASSPGQAAAPAAAHTTLLQAAAVAQQHDAAAGAQHSQLVQQPQLGQQMATPAHGAGAGLDSLQRNLDADPDLDALDEEEMAVLRVLQSYSTPAPAASVSHVHQAPPQLYPSQALPEAKTTLAQPQAPALLAQPPQRLQRQLHWPGGEQGALPRQPPAEQPSLEGFCQEVLQQHMLQQALKFWRAAALRGQRARMLASARLEQWQQQRQQAQMAGMLSAWRALVAAWMKRDALLSQAMDLMHRRWTLRGALHKWRLALHLSVCEQLADEQHGHWLALTALRAWRLVVGQRAARLFLAQAVVDGRNGELLQAVFSAWRRRGEVSSLGRWLLALTQQRLLHRAFLAWLAQVHSGQLLLAHTAAIHQQRLLSKCLWGWRHQYLPHVGRKRLVQSMQMVLVDGFLAAQARARLRGALLQWRDLTQAAAPAKAAAATLLQRAWARSVVADWLHAVRTVPDSWLCQLLLGWRKRAAHKRAKAERMEFAQRAYALGLLQKAWRSWVVRWCRGAGVRVMVAHRQQRLLLSCLREWAAQAQQTEQLSQLLRVCCLQRLVRAWHRAAHALQQQERQQELTAACYWECRMQRSVLEHLHSVSQQLAAGSRRRAEAAQLYQRHRLLATCLSAWREALALSKSEAATDLWARQRRVKGCLAAWHELVFLLPVEAEVSSRRRLRTLRRTLFGWAALVVARRARIARAEQQKALVLMGRAMQLWKLLAERRRWMRRKALILKAANAQLRASRIRAAAMAAAASPSPAAAMGSTKRSPGGSRSTSAHLMSALRAQATGPTAASGDAARTAALRKLAARRAEARGASFGDGPVAPEATSRSAAAAAPQPPAPEHTPAKSSSYTDMGLRRAQARAKPATPAAPWPTMAPMPPVPSPAAAEIVSGIVTAGPATTRTLNASPWRRTPPPRVHQLSPPRVHQLSASPPSAASPHGDSSTVAAQRQALVAAAAADALRRSKPASPLPALPQAVREPQHSNAGSPTMGLVRSSPLAAGPSAPSTAQTKSVHASTGSSHSQTSTPTRSSAPRAGEPSPGRSGGASLPTPQPAVHSSPAALLAPIPEGRPQEHWTAVQLEQEAHKQRMMAMMAAEFGMTFASPASDSGSGTESSDSDAAGLLALVQDDGDEEDEEAMGDAGSAAGNDDSLAILNPTARARNSASGSHGSGTLLQNDTGQAAQAPATAAPAGVAAWEEQPGDAHRMQLALRLWRQNMQRSVFMAWLELTLAAVLQRDQQHTAAAAAATSAPAAAARTPDHSMLPKDAAMSPPPSGASLTDSPAAGASYVARTPSAWVQGLLSPPSSDEEGPAAVKGSVMPRASNNLPPPISQRQLQARLATAAGSSSSILAAAQPPQQFHDTQPLPLRSQEPADQRRTSVSAPASQVGTPTAPRGQHAAVTEEEYEDDFEQDPADLDLDLDLGLAGNQLDQDLDDLLAMAGGGTLQ